MKKYSRNIILFITGTFAFGLSQAFMGLFLNFYLKGLGMTDASVGFVNAIPAVMSAVISLPTVILTRRLGETKVLRLGIFIGVIGSLVMLIAGGPLLAVIGSFLGGIGGTLLGIASAPFLADNTTEDNRVGIFSVQSALGVGAGFLGNLIGGLVPGWYASYAGVAPDSLEALRSAIFVAFVIQIIGAVQVSLIRQKDHIQNTNLSLKVYDKVLISRLLAPSVVVGLGAGAVIPFLNIFIEAKFKIDYASLGAIFAWTSLATAVTVLIQPLLVKRFSHMQTVILMQTLSLPFLVILGYSPWLWLVIVAMFTRGALMNAANPVMSAYAMNLLNSDDRPMYSALNMIFWNTGWALSSTLSGVFRQFFGPQRIVEAFNYLFAFTILMYILNTFLIWFLILRNEKKAVKNPSESV